MLKKITKWETEDGTVFDTQEEAEDYMFEQDKEVMAQTTEQERVDFPSPALLTKLQTSTEGGAILVDDYAGGYDLLTEILRVIVADEAARHAPAVPVPVPDIARDTLQYIHDTFKRDLDAGYVTKDKRFAVDVAAEALATAPQPPEAAPVDLPEPSVVVICELEKAPYISSVFGISYGANNLYTEQQVVSLLKSHGISVKTSK